MGSSGLRAAPELALTAVPPVPRAAATEAAAERGTGSARPCGAVVSGAARDGAGGAGIGTEGLGSSWLDTPLPWLLRSRSGRQSRGSALRLGCPGLPAVAADRFCYEKLNVEGTERGNCGRKGSGWVQCNKQ